MPPSLTINPSASAIVIELPTDVPPSSRFYSAAVVSTAASFVKYFPLSTVYCLDINLTNFKFISKNMKIFGLDVSKKRMIRKF